MWSFLQITMSRKQAKKINATGRLLAHPNWVNSARLLELAQQIVREKTVDAARLQHELHSAWHLSDKPELRELVLAEARGTLLYDALQMNGLPVPAVNCLMLLYALAFEGMTPKQVRRELGGLLKRLEEEQDHPHAPWDDAERATHESTLLNVGRLVEAAQVAEVHRLAGNFSISRRKASSPVPGLEAAEVHGLQGLLPLQTTQLHGRPRARVADPAPFNEGELSGAFKELLERLELRLVESAPGALRASKQLRVPLAVVLAEREYHFDAQLTLVFTMEQPRARKLNAWRARVESLLSSESVAMVVQRVNHALVELFTAYHTVLTPEQFTSLAESMRLALETGVSVWVEDTSLNARDWLPPQQLALLAQVDARRAENLLQIKDYPQSFSLARTLGRRLHARLGPTNSGKTWDALNALARAPSGVYLAPLRLLALEVRDRLMEQGVPCNLLTGEDREFVPGARHTACTIEMLNPAEMLDVAVIDEIQMLADPDRGWAWTAALVGVSAKDVFLCGSACAMPCLAHAALGMGEPLDVTLLERKNKLEVEPFTEEHAAVGSRKKHKRAVQVDGGEARHLQPGDAVIAFSRRDVLTLSARYREAGWRVSTIYGALAPEVRRAEAQKFAKGETDIVVATDAVGMGLNLPIRRVVFSTVVKFDGQSVRELLPTELQQIAGRAGRYGLHDKGIVTTIDPEELPFLRKTLKEELPTLPDKLSVAPNFWHVQALAALLNTQQIGPILAYFARELATDSPAFGASSLEGPIALGHKVDNMAHNARAAVDVADKFVLACAPVDSAKPSDMEFYVQCVSALLFNKKKPLPVLPAWLSSNNSSMLEEAELLSRCVGLYAWLGNKYPEVFPDVHKVPEARSVIGAYIERALLRQTGFVLTAKEAREGAAAPAPEKTREHGKKHQRKKQGKAKRG